MVATQQLTREHKELIINALRTVIRTQWSLGVKLNPDELSKLQECMRIIDNWKGGDTHEKN